MKKTNLTELMKKYEEKDITRYALVMAIAKRARTIQQHAEENGVRLTEKPVMLATDDLYCDRIKIVEDVKE